MRTKII